MNLKFDRKDIFTIPNLLSFFRIILIPVIILLYCKYKMYSATTLVILISSATDVIDGWIARKFRMISDFGKILDPVSDKLTQAAIVVCLFVRFPHMIYLFVLMALKETMMGITGLIRIRKSGEVHCADWHGKVNTCLIYAMLLLHIVWYNIPKTISDISMAIVAAMMILSMVLYVSANIKMIKKGRS